MKVIINGAGIAGPTLAWFLHQSGHDVLLVEEAPQLRRGGYVIDFWGLGYDLAERMGILPRVTELGYRMRRVRFVDRRGRTSGGFPIEVLGRMTRGRFTSLRRSDLAAEIYGALNGRVETIFGDSVVDIQDTGDRVRVGFEHAAAREADLVVGADGLHSRVRRLAFGPEGRFAFPLGYHVAAFETEGYRPRDELEYIGYSLPGRQISRFAMREDRTLFLFIFRDEYLAGASPATEGEQKSALQRIFGEAGWECAQILAALDRTKGVYFDQVGQIRMDRWSTGRVVLIGDAAACVSLLAGEGTGLAMAEAYVLAGELEECAGNYRAALEQYQARLMPFLQRKQRSAAAFASSFAPATALGIGFRNLVSRLLGIPWIADFFIGRDLRDDIVLPVYGRMRNGPLAAG